MTSTRVTGKMIVPEQGTSCWVAQIIDPSNCLPFNNLEDGHLRLALFGATYRGIKVQGYYRDRSDIPFNEAGFVQIGDIGGIVVVQFMPALAEKKT